MTNVDIRALAKLARLEVSDGESAKLETEIQHILRFVDTIQGVEARDDEANRILCNVMREDGVPHESGIHTEKLLGAAPSREGDRIAVRQVLSRKK